MTDYLLDSSFVIDLLNEIAGTDGPATRWLEQHTRARLWISPITLAEALEGADDPAFVRAFLANFRWQSIHRTHASSVAMIQRRRSSRLGENDAWQCAIVEAMKGAIVAHDAKAFAHLGVRYEDYHAKR